VSSAGLRPKSDCSAKAQKQLYSNLQTRPLVRGGATNLQTRKYLKKISRWKKNWSQVPNGRLTPEHTDRLTVGRKLTLTHSLTCFGFLYSFIGKKICQQNTNSKLRGRLDLASSHIRIPAAIRLDHLMFSEHFLTSRTGKAPVNRMAENVSYYSNKRWSLRHAPILEQKKSHHTNSAYFRWTFFGEVEGAVWQA
jgi:hypothetical protein